MVSKVHRAAILTDLKSSLGETESKKSTNTISESDTMYQERLLYIRLPRKLLRRVIIWSETQMMGVCEEDRHKAENELSGSRNSMCKGPKAEVSMMCCRKWKNAGMAGIENRRRVTKWSIWVYILFLRQLEVGIMLRHFSSSLLRTQLLDSYLVSIKNVFSCK